VIKSVLHLLHLIKISSSRGVLGCDVL